MSIVEEKIRTRAYELWERAGCPEGRSWEFWFSARAEFEGQNSAAGQESGDRPVDEHGVIDESAEEVPETPSAKQAVVSSETRASAGPKPRRA